MYNPHGGVVGGAGLFGALATTGADFPVFFVILCSSAAMMVGALLMRSARNRAASDSL